jgi:ferrous iron transport protein B
VARRGDGLDLLIKTVADVATGQTVCRPYRIKSQSQEVREAVNRLSSQIKTLYPDLPNARWLALRLLDGDQRIAQALRSGEFVELIQTEAAGQRQSLDLNLGVASQ